MPSSALHLPHPQSGVDALLAEVEKQKKVGGLSCLVHRICDAANHPAMPHELAKHEQMLRVNAFWGSCLGNQWRA